MKTLLKILATRTGFLVGLLIFLGLAGPSLLAFVLGNVWGALAVACIANAALSHLLFLYLTALPGDIAEALKLEEDLR